MDNTAHTMEQHIRTAYELVRRLDISEPELRVEAFRYALRQETVPATRPQSKAAVTPSAYSGDDQSVYQGIANGLDMPLELMELLYDFDGRVLRLNIPPKALPDSMSAAMREIAIMVAVGRKHAGLGTSTPLEIIRSACDELGKLDKKNFAVAMTGMKPRLTTAGKGAERELVPKRPADDWAREIIGRYMQVVG